MTGLDLESFLKLLGADHGSWATLGLIALVLGLMTWTSWGSRRALRKCLVLSVVAHFGIALYGGTMPGLLMSLRSEPADAPAERIRQIKVQTGASTESQESVLEASSGKSGAGFASWDKPPVGLALADAKLVGPKSVGLAEPVVRPGERAELKAEGATPENAPPAPPLPEERAREEGAEPGAAPRLTPIGEDEVAAPVVAERSGLGAADGRIRPVREMKGDVAPGRRPKFTNDLENVEAPLPGSLKPDGMSSGALAVRPAASVEAVPGPVPLEGIRTARLGEQHGEGVAEEVVKTPVAALPVLGRMEGDVRRRSRPEALSGVEEARPRPAPIGTLAMSRVTPSGVPALPEIQGAAGGRPLTDVPEVYRSRLDPNRSARAFRSGASPASEQAVERSLDWLARHQDTDGRWDGATAKYDDGTAVKGDDDYTVHCPPGETCFGECIYWEADTALTGLALLSYLGAGYTQTDGKYAETVGKGLDFLLAAQRPDGDLRGKSRAVGMYCHAMATIALCEAYALTGDDRLRPAVERAVSFLVNGRAKDGLAWRYSPGATVGDTSILGWVVMALKSAREVGIAVPGSMQTGTLGWLGKVSTGGSNGLARYQPWDNVTPTMTAEAWVCRQFLGVGGPGAASSEAAEYLLAHGPKSDVYNLYYWYYGTLAMYQHGGDSWFRWNVQVRDEIVRRQRASGHSAGSWDPDDSPYGAKGGRIYCTALATLSLEVYYRYLRLYDEPKIPPAMAPGRMRGARDPALGRLGGDQSR